MKEKNYTLTVDIHVSKEDSSAAKRWYSLKIYGHPIKDNPEPLEFDLSNMRTEQTLKVGKKLLDAIWKLVEETDGDYWKA
jgi:hypothetical protein